MYLAKQYVPGLEAQKSEATYNERQQSGTLSKQSLQIKVLSEMILHKGLSCQECGVEWAEDVKKQLFLAASCEMSELLSVASHQMPWVFPLLKQTLWGLICNFAAKNDVQ